MASRKQNRRRATIIGSVIGVIIIFSFVITLIAPDLGTSSTTSDAVFNTPEPTAIIIPTPDPDPQLGGAAPFIHNSGVFSAFRPAGGDWTVTESGPDANTGIVRVVMQSPARLAVIHNYIQPGVEYETLDSLSANLLTANHFASAWSDYDTWVETNRAVTDDAVIVDFDLESESVAYAGRSLDWVQDSRLFATRLVVPANNAALLDLLQPYVLAQFTMLPGIAALPVEWPAYIEQSTGYVLKYPAGWQQVAGGPGRPVTFSTTSDQGELVIRTWAAPDRRLESREQVAVWLASVESTAEALTIAPVEQRGGTGYEVAYTFIDTAGDARSGLVLLVNDADDTLFAVNLQTTLLDRDLLTVDDVPASVRDAIRALREGFVILPPEMRG